jgi:hypothetical protein
LFAGIGPALWIVYSWLVAREVQWRRAVGVAAKTGLLTIATSLWWIAGLAIQGGYGLDILKYTETVETVARTSTPNEIMRGLGYWFFYGQDRLGPWIEASSNYTQRPVVILAGYALAALALLSAVLVRWRHRVFFVALMIVGVIIAVGAHPYGSPTPLGSVFKAFATGSTAGLAMRSTARAVPLVVLATAVLLGVGTNAVYTALRRNARPLLAYGAVALVVVLVLVNFPALVDGTFYGKNLDRPENIPQYWTDAAAALDARGDSTRVLELPGSDFASYRWGNTVDPVTPGIMDRPYVARELIPWGSPGTADLLNALDAHIQEGTFDPAGFSAVVRRLGVGDVVLRNDLQYERYNLVSPREVNREFANVPGLGAPTGYGPPTAYQTETPSQDESSLAAPANEVPPSPVVVYPVENPVPIVRGESTHNALMLAGDGEGLIDAASVGLLDGAGIVQYSGSYATRPGLRAAIAPDATLVLTDSNRRQARRWSSVLDNVGVTEQPGEKPLVDDPSDARLDLFPASSDSAHTTMDQQGVAWATATSYGNTITYTPEDRAARAFDGDVDTAWRGAAFGTAIGQRIRIDLDHAITADHVGLVQPINGARDRFITKVQLRFDGGDPIDVDLDATSRTAEGQTIDFSPRTFKRLEIEITDTNLGRRRLNGNTNAVGFAEVRVEDTNTGAPVRVREVVRMPSDLLAATGPASTAHPLVVIMNRERSRPVPPRSDPELAIVREFTLPDAREFSLTGTARVTPTATAASIETALGQPSIDQGGVQADASEFLEGCVNCRPDAAIDGDLATAWQTPFQRVRGQWADYGLPAPITFDHMNLSVFADGRHSVPTSIRLEVGDDVRELTLPPIPDQPSENAVYTVPLTFPAVTGDHVRITIDDVREVQTFNYFSHSNTLAPVAIAELGIPGLQSPALAGSVPGDCRSDLLRIDGAAVPVRVVGSTANGRTLGPLTVAPCDPANPTSMPTFTLRPGRHVVDATPGKQTGVQLDRLVLASAAGGAPLAVSDGRVTGLPATPPPAPKVEVVHDGRTRMRVHVEGADEPFWLVLGQSENAGWEATTDGATVGPRRLVDGYANGWRLQPHTDAFDVVLEWTPQQRVWASLWLSLAAGILCVVIVAVTWWKRRAVLALITAPDPADARVSLAWPGSANDPDVAIGPVPAAVAGLVVVGGGIAGAVIAAPWVGLVVAIALAAALRWRAARVVLALTPAVLLGLAGLYIAFAQIRYRTPPIFEWPTVYPRARTLGWFAVLLTGGAVLVDVVLRAAGRKRAPPE